MKSIELFVGKYDEDHPTVFPKIIRLFAVLFLNFGVLALLWQLPDTLIRSWMGDREFANWATVYSVLLIIYYGSESFSLTFGGGFFMLGSLFVTQRLSMMFPEDLLIVSGILIGVSAFFFLIGRLISKSLKNFLNDIIYLPIQPVWVLSYLYRWIGLSI
ncbi:MAG: hypothetical protein OEW75_00110 [Cyclobacteriaceae bacterium]|nr:hypothetical protein [Cyclobacteriaceae bacterium]